MREEIHKQSEELKRQQARQQQLEDRMRQAFLRGVSLMNLEAMTLLDQAKDPNQPLPTAPISAIDPTHVDPALTMAQLLSKHQPVHNQRGGEHKHADSEHHALHL